MWIEGPAAPSHGPTLEGMDHFDGTHGFDDDDLDDIGDDLDRLDDVAVLADRRPHQVVRLSGADDILGVLPWRLGFHPDESLVLAVLQGPRQRERLVMRLDLPDQDDEEDVARDAAARAAAAGADAVFVAVFTDEVSRYAGDLPRSDLVDAVAAALDEEGIDLVDAVLVQDHRRWSYLCADPRCCPPDGIPLPTEPSPAIDAYAAEVVARGATVLPSRTALRSRVEPSSAPPDVAARTTAVDAVTGLVADGLDPEQVGVGLLDALRSRFAAGRRHPPSAVDARLVATALAAPAVRESLLTAVLDPDEEAVRDLLGQVARLVPDDVAGPVCAVLAWLSYAGGDGALAAIALERAVRADPGAALPRLLATGIDLMVPPEQIRRVCRQVRAGPAGGVA